MLLINSNNTLPIAADNASYNLCGHHPKATVLAELIIEHIDQQRSFLACHPTLAITAAKKAKTMAINQRIEHNLSFQAPNQLIESYGYELPAEFLPTSNQVESLAGGSSQPEHILQNLLDSSAHRSHILGLDKLSEKQIHIGVGYYYDKNTPHEHHWVVHIAMPKVKKREARQQTN